MLEECTHIDANGAKCRGQAVDGHGDGVVATFPRATRRPLQPEAKYFGTKCIDKFYFACK